VVRRRSAKPLFIGSNPIGASSSFKLGGKMASYSKITKTKRASKKAKMGLKRKKDAQKPGTYKKLPLTEKN
jgi:hypothetical protein